MLRDQTAGDGVPAGRVGKGIDIDQRTQQRRHSTLRRTSRARARVSGEKTFWDSAKTLAQAVTGFSPWKSGFFPGIPQAGILSAIYSAHHECPIDSSNLKLPSLSVLSGGPRAELHGHRRFHAMQRSRDRALLRGRRAPGLPRVPAAIAHAAGRSRRAVRRQACRDRVSASRALSHAAKPGSVRGERDAVGLEVPVPERRPFSIIPPRSPFGERHLQGCPLCPAAVLGSNLSALPLQLFPLRIFPASSSPGYERISASVG